MVLFPKALWARGQGGWGGVFVASPKPPEPGQVRRTDEDLSAWQEARR
jgi:hypothetical protein